jgi:hypothetical protein
MTAPPIDPRRLLAALRDRIGEGLSPAGVVEEFLPTTKAHALAYARRLPLWDEFRGSSPRRRWPSPASCPGGPCASTASR